MPALAEPREERDHALEPGRALAAGRAPRTELQVLAHGHSREQLAPLGNV